MQLLFSFFNDACKVFENAAKIFSTVEQWYAIANHTVRLRFASPQCAHVLSPALEHLVVDHGRSPSLTVCLWDNNAAEDPLPPFPWEKHPPATPNIERLNEGSNPVIYCKDERIRGAYQIGSKTLSMFDSRRSLAIFWTPDIQKIPYYERSAPLRSIFQWWGSQRGLQLTHAGAVGNNHGGVLLVGKGGTGKSTTALACLHSELSYLSDDYCFLDLAHRPLVHGIYSSAKIDAMGLQRFSYLGSAVENKEKLDEEKGLLFLNKHWPGKILRDFPVSALLVPRITDAEKTALFPASPRDTLMALAPSTMLQSRGARQEDLTSMANLTRIIPGFFLNLGKDIENVPGLIMKLLSDKGAVLKTNHPKGSCPCRGLW